MMSKIILSVVFSSVILGGVISEQPTDQLNREEKASPLDLQTSLQSGLQMLFDGLYFNKVLEKNEKKDNKKPTTTTTTQKPLLQNLFDTFYFNKFTSTAKPSKYEGGDTTITGAGGEFFKPKQANETEDGQVFRTYTAEMIPNSDDNIVQIQVIINSLILLPPTEGDCVADKFEITGANPGIEIPAMCGTITDQTIYFDIDNSVGPYLMVMTTLAASENQTAQATLRSFTRFWNLSVAYLTADQAVTRRCLQFHNNPSGVIKSFNYGGGQMINNMNYVICFGYVSGFCNVAFEFENFELGTIGETETPTTDPVTEPITEPVTEPTTESSFGNRTSPLRFGINRREGQGCSNNCEDDYIFIGDEKWCGNCTGQSIIANATGPIIVGVRSDDANEMGEKGFKATYSMFGC